MSSEGGFHLSKRNVGFLLGGLSILTAIMSAIFFYVRRGPNTDIYFVVLIYSILSVIGILLAILSWLASKRLILPIIGLLANGLVLGAAFLLLLAMGMSEP